MTISEFIKKRSYLLWHVNEYDKLSKEAVVEAVLNYGNWEDFKMLLTILGRKEVARIFKEKSKAKRNNYNAKTRNYFELYFGKYA